MADFNRGGFKRDFGPREMHKATCSECKQQCEVPFKPTEGKPVYCKECYGKRRKFWFFLVHLNKDTDIAFNAALNKPEA